MDDMRIHGNFAPPGGALGAKTPALGGNGNENSPFANTLTETLNEVNKMQLDADKAVEDLVTGQTKNIHETMMRIGKAEIAFKLTLQVRNKVLEAYKEIIRTAV